MDRHGTMRNLQRLALGETRAVTAAGGPASPASGLCAHESAALGFRKRPGRDLPVVSLSRTTGRDSVSVELAAPDYLERDAKSSERSFICVNFILLDVDVVGSA